MKWRLRGMKVLMLTSEAVPYAKSGGLADMVSALSLSIKALSCDVRILMPLYDFIDDSDFRSLGSIRVDMVHRHEEAEILTTALDESHIPVYFLKSYKYFSRKGIYGPTPSTSYPDNAHRFSFLSRSFIELCLHLDWIPDILHSHDWPSAPAAIYLNEAPETFGKTKSVFTIHNMGYQGTFHKPDLPWMGLSLEQSQNLHMLKNGQINFLKTGIENNNHITTVSPSYALEIQTMPFGHGLDQSLSHRKDDLTGILNGVDYESWNPETDTLISPDNYSLSNLSGKGKCKSRLQQIMGLEIDPQKPLFAMISRLVEQKGIEELCRPGYGVLEDFCRDNNVQVVILGTGEPWCEQELIRLNSCLPNLSVKIDYIENLSHLIEAGADFFLMPSRYEPCGLNQLYSLKYGTIPIVTRTGGLADSVRDADDSGEDNSTGFVFKKEDVTELKKVLKRAVDCWFDTPEKIIEMRNRGMAEDFSWPPSAQSYLQIYRTLSSIN